MKKTVWLGMALFGISTLGVLLSACGAGSKPAAVVNGETITVQDIEQRFSALSPAVRDSIGNDKAKVLDQLVMETLLMQEARKRRMESDSEVVRLMHDARKQIMFGRLFELQRICVRLLVQELAVVASAIGKTLVEVQDVDCLILVIT